MNETLMLKVWAWILGPDDVTRYIWIAALTSGALSIPCTMLAVVLRVPVLLWFSVAFIFGICLAAGIGNLVHATS